MQHKIFVYGTLKMGYGNHAILGSKREYLGIGKTVNCYMMYQTGFPVVMNLKNKDDKGYCVSGELYLVDDDALLSLDTLEANGSMYQREEVELEVEGKKVIAWMYIGLPSCWTPERISRMVETKLNEDMCYRY